jgi:predicted ATPase/DNA-binding CsgD family transcriptional regulator
LIGRPLSLPARRARLLGRDDVVRSVAAALAGSGRADSDGHGDAPRLLTITGPGGAGKTTLALEVARKAEPAFAEGAAFAELGAVDEPEAVAHTVAVALGLADAGATSLDDVVAFLRARELLLVIDNCEQVAAAAATVCDRLLDRCAGLRILATSRSSLRVRGEHVVAIPPLPVPAPDERVAPRALEAVPSVALFVERARAADPSFRLDERTAPSVAAICARLDGLPLAIELAAAQAGAIPVADIAARLETDAGFLGLAAQAGTGRPRTLEAAFDWSYRLLDEDEQTLLRRLAVFDGGWTLEAAEEICAGGITATTSALQALLGSTTPANPSATAGGALHAALEAAKPSAGLPQALPALGAPVASLLARLVDHSLVVREATGDRVRYRMLRPIGEIATARLAASGELAGVLGVHAVAFLALARTRRHDSTYASPADLARIEADEANCLRALASLQAAGIVPAALALAAALIEYWRVRGHLRTGREILESAILSADPASLEPQVLPVRAFALLAAADFSTLLGDFDAAEAYVDEGDAVFAAMGIVVGQATAAAMRGNIAAGRGDFEACRAWYERSREIVGDGVLDLTRMFWLASLGSQELSFGRSDEAWEHLLAARDLSATVPETWYHGRIAGHLGMAARVRGDLETARPLLIEGLRRLAAYGARVELIPVLEGLAGLAVDGGDAPRAATLFGAASVLREFTGVGDTPATGTASRRDLGRVRDALRLPVLAAAWARGRAMTLDEVLLYAAADDAGPSGLRGAPGSELTGRERDVALLVARGLTNAEIARELGISAGTARIHVERILRKLGLTSRVQVATWVVDGGLDPTA